MFRLKAGEWPEELHKHNKVTSLSSFILFSLIFFFLICLFCRGAHPVCFPLRWTLAVYPPNLCWHVLRDQKGSDWALTSIFTISPDWITQQHISILITHTHTHTRWVSTPELAGLCPGRSCGEIRQSETETTRGQINTTPLTHFLGWVSTCPAYMPLINEGVLRVPGTSLQTPSPNPSPSATFKPLLHPSFLLQFILAFIFPPITPHSSSWWRRWYILHTKVCAFQPKVINYHK